MLFFFLLALCYLGISYWILFASSLWTLHFGLELQWMFLCIFIIVGSSVWSGLLNYLILNGILSTLLIISLLLNNLVFFMFGCFGKVGYFPFFLILSYQYCSSSYIWILFDLMNNLAYFGSIIFSIYFSFLCFFFFCDWYVLMNFLMIVFLIRFVLSMNHFILISSLQLFLLFLSSLYFEDELLCFDYLLYYLITTIYIIWDCQGYTGGAYYVIFFAFYLSLSLPYFFTDLTSIKELVNINSVLYILYIFYCFSFFPTIMFLLKLFILFSFISSSLCFAFLLAVYIIFSLQSFYLSSLGIILEYWALNIKL